MRSRGRGWPAWMAAQEQVRGHVEGEGRRARGAAVGEAAQACAPGGTAVAALALPVRRRLVVGKSWRERWMKLSRRAAASAGGSPLTRPAGKGNRWLGALGRRVNAAAPARAPRGRQEECMWDYYCGGVGGGWGGVGWGVMGSLPAVQASMQPCPAAGLPPTHALPAGQHGQRQATSPTQGAQGRSRAPARCSTDCTRARQMNPGRPGRTKRARRGVGPLVPNRQRGSACNSNPPEPSIIRQS